MPDEYDARRLVPVLSHRTRSDRNEQAMNELLDQIEARYKAIRRSVGLGRSLYRGLDAAMASARDVPRLLAAVRAVEALADWHETKAEKARLYPGPAHAQMAKAAVVHDDAAQRIRRALNEALEGEG